MNRDRPATMLTKREHAAIAIFAANLRVGIDGAVALADELFDLLDKPAKLRDEPYFDHEGTP